MTQTETQSNFNEILAMSPVRPFPDEPDKIFRIMNVFGYTLNSIAFETGVAHSTVGKFIHNKCHSSRVALWFEGRGVFLDRDYPDPNRSSKTILNRVVV